VSAGTTYVHDSALSRPVVLRLWQVAPWRAFRWNQTKLDGISCVECILLGMLDIQVASQCGELEGTHAIPNPPQIPAFLYQMMHVASPEVNLQICISENLPKAFTQTLLVDSCLQPQQP
jgi:hypothetical protein